MSRNPVKLSRKRLLGAPLPRDAVLVLEAPERRSRMRVDDRAGRFLAQFADLRQEEPLVGVGAKLLVDEDAVAAALRPTLEGRGDQVSEPSFGNGRLSREHAVVSIESDRFRMRHRLRDERAAEVAGELRAYGALEEEPDVAAVARARPLHACLQAVRLRGLSDGVRGVLPLALVEIHDEKRRGRVLVERVKAENVAEPVVQALEMADDRGVRQGRERLLLAKGALRMRVLDARAHPALPFVFAGGDVADAAVFPAESVRMDVGPSFEERPEQRNLLVRRALRCDEAARPRGFVDRGGGFEPEPLFDVALLGFGGVAACASANDCGVAAGRRDRLDRLDRDIELVVEKRVLRERLLHGLAFRFAWSLTLGEGVVGGMIPRGAPRRCCATPVSVPVFSGFLRAFWRDWVGELGPRQISGGLVRLLGLRTVFRSNRRQPRVP